MITRKVCLLGAFAVGKSSLVRRFVKGIFGDRYVTTLGLKIDTKTVETTVGPVKLIIWDMEGTFAADQESQLINSRMNAYLKGVDGVLLVADGTRPTTLEVARRLIKWLDLEHSGVPIVLLLNKSDLAEEWQVNEQDLEDFVRPVKIFKTSALSGIRVESAFKHLAGVLGGHS